MSTGTSAHSHDAPGTGEVSPVTPLRFRSCHPRPAETCCDGPRIQAIFRRPCSARRSMSPPGPRGTTLDEDCLWAIGGASSAGTSHCGPCSRSAHRGNRPGSRSRASRRAAGPGFCRKLTAQLAGRRKRWQSKRLRRRRSRWTREWAGPGPRSSPPGWCPGKKFCWLSRTWQPIFASLGIIERRDPAAADEQQHEPGRRSRQSFQPLDQARLEMSPMARSRAGRRGAVLGSYLARAPRSGMPRPLPRPCTRPAGSGSRMATLRFRGLPHSLWARIGGPDGNAEPVGGDPRPPFATPAWALHTGQ